MSAYGRSAVSALAARGAGVAASESLSQRSLFVRVRPPPASLSERRSVLRVLERYGKTEMFKKMADNASFIAIASSAAMANALIKRSPIQYEFMAETFQAAQPWGQPRVATLVQPIETGSGPGGRPSTPSVDEPAARRQTDHVAHKAFVLSVFPSQNYHHRTMIQNAPLHGPWPADAAVTTPAATATYKHTFVYNALRSVVPQSASSEGLCDWRSRDGGSDATTAAPTTSAQVSSTAGEGGGDSSHSSHGSSNSSSSSRGRPGRPTLAETIQHIRQRKARKAQANRSVIGSLLAQSDTEAKADGKDDPDR